MRLGSSSLVRSGFFGVVGKLFGLSGSHPFCDWVRRLTRMGGRCFRFFVRFSKRQYSGKYSFAAKPEYGK